MIIFVRDDASYTVVVGCSLHVHAVASELISECMGRVASKEREPIGGLRPDPLSAGPSKKCICLYSFIANCQTAVVLYTRIKQSAGLKYIKVNT